MSSLISYVAVYKIDNSIYEGQYVSLEQAMDLLKKYKLYIFKFSKEHHIIYLNYPLENYYKLDKINILSDDNKEEDIESFEYIELRLIDKSPSIRIGVNMEDL
jgi:hypothetical protein